jgi:hypothetical protein
LDNSIDTEAEVEAILRIFPNVLSRRKPIFWTDEGRCFYYPIQLLAFKIHEDESLRINLKAVSFIPVVARLAIEFGCFNGDEFETRIVMSGYSFQYQFFAKSHV